MNLLSPAFDSPPIYSTQLDNHQVLVVVVVLQLLPGAPFQEKNTRVLSFQFTFQAQSLSLTSGYFPCYYIMHYVQYESLHTLG